MNLDSRGCCPAAVGEILCLLALFKAIQQKVLFGFVLIISLQSVFSIILSNLFSTAPQSEEGNGFSLEEKSKKASKRVHYMKFTKGTSCFFVTVQRRTNHTVFYVLIQPIFIMFNCVFSDICQAFKTAKPKNLK